MSLKDKIAVYVARHGYNLKAFVLCGLVFPPAALFIAVKHPSWSTLQRALALTGLVIFLAGMPFVGAAAVAFVAQSLQPFFQ